MFASLCAVMIALASDKAPDLTLIDSKALMDQASRATVSPDVAMMLERYGAFAGGAGMKGYVDERAGLLLFSSSDDKDSRHMLQLLADAKVKLVTSMALPQVGRSENKGQALMVFHFTSQGKYEALLDQLALAYPHLQKWVPKAKSFSGFSLPDPAMVVVLENELAHRDRTRDSLLTHLTGHALVGQQFGEQPFWMQEGVALHLESSLSDKLGAFCVCQSFQPINRPGAWKEEMTRAWQQVSSAQLSALLSLSSEQATLADTLRALGLVRHLLTSDPAKVVSFMTTIDQRRVDADPGTPYDILSAANQLSILTDIYGSDFVSSTLAALSPQVKTTKPDRAQKPTKKAGGKRS